MNKRGYLQVKLGGQKPYLVHHLVAHAFLGPRLEGMTINHINGDRSDPSVANLEYITQGENNRHAWRTGLQRSGWATRRARAVGGFGPNGSYLDA